ncbi:plasmid transfer protein TraA [Streptomyces sp. NPDC001455]|uniref:plasmid transfer protein TraA n=1 Tax=Streptomyces sp. NPDC001455 TaxID=3154518 RepID=UPI00331F3FFC
MASSASTQANDFARQQTQRPFTPPPRNGSGGGVRSGTGKADKEYNKNFGATFSPGLTITVNAGNKTTAAAPAQGSGGQGGGGSHFILGEPDFNNTEDVRAYCNHVRALMLQAAIELAIGSKILEARLAQAQALPGDTVVQTRMRAKRVSRKLKKAADGATAAAKSAVGAYAAFNREYSDLMRPRPQEQQRVHHNPFKF